MTLLAEQAAQFDLFQFLQVTGTPGTILVLYIVWWRTVGKDKAEHDRATAEAQQRAALVLAEATQNVYRLHDKISDEASRVVSRGERVCERLDERFPSGVINPP